MKMMSAKFYNDIAKIERLVRVYIDRETDMAQLVKLASVIHHVQGIKIKITKSSSESCLK